MSQPVKNTANLLIYCLPLRFSMISLKTSPLYALLTVPWAAHANSPRDRKQNLGA